MGGIGDFRNSLIVASIPLTVATSGLRGFLTISSENAKEKSVDKF
jgi:hypothetical protein